MGIADSKKHIKLWDDSKNGLIKDLGFYNQSKKYWWKCGCGFEWESYVISVTRKGSAQCRECSKKDNGFVDFEGKTIGYWKVLYKSDKKTKASCFWRCLCLCCDREYDVRSDNLRSKMTKKCLDCHAKEVKNKWPIASTHWSSIRGGAQQRGYEFEISVDQMFELFEKQNKRCALTGDKLVLYSDNKEYAKLSPRMSDYASLDRIDSSRGYVSGNVQWVRKDINLMKMAMGQDEFIDLCNKVAKHCL